MTELVDEIGKLSLNCPATFDLNRYSESSTFHTHENENCGKKNFLQLLAWVIGNEYTSDEDVKILKALQTSITNGDYDC